MNKKPITVTQPSLPPLDEFIPYLESIWEDKWLTNNGKFHRELEDELERFLGVKHLALCSNGTLALMIALKALDVQGEVITTPFSFVATSHSLLWTGAVPVFCDIEDKTYNLDPEKIEALITERTTAILPVHVYGNPCDDERIGKIAQRHGLKVLYDAAHAFHVKKKGQSILTWGDLSVLSFHATKVFNTFEGGAVICHTEEMKQKVKDLKNFGIRGETAVVSSGMNAKMNEVQAAMGLAQLKYLEQNIAKRRKVANHYHELLDGLPGITLPHRRADVSGNYSYFPVLIDGSYGPSRDAVYDLLKRHDILSRKYFYPLITHFPMYAGLPSAPAEKLPCAERIAAQVLCLPIYPDLSRADVEKICLLIRDGEK